MAADKRAARLGVLALVATLLFGAVGTRLWFLQTVQADSLQATVDQSKVRTIPLIPERGRIFDATGRILADNDRLLVATVDWEVMRRDTDRAELFSRLSGWLEMPVAEMEERYDSELYSRYRPMPLKEDVREDVAIALGERAEDFPGVTVETEWERTYPYAPLASHVLGYMGAITEEDADKYEALGYDISKGGENVGRSGIELSMEEVLHGKWGERIVEVDARNRIVREISRREPVNGNDIQLSINLDWQQYAERVLQTQLQYRKQFFVNNFLTALDGTKTPIDPTQPEQVPYKAPAGSVIVMNQETGQIGAMASFPTFDNRWFNAEVPDDKFDQLFPRPIPGGAPVDPDLSSLTNRAVQGQYNMGSAFKVFIAYAALATGLINSGTEYDDQGTYTISRIDPAQCQTNGGPFDCEYRNSLCGNLPCVYGLVNVAESLAVSSDAFYYKLGEDFFYAAGTQLQDQVRQFGFGADTGIDLPFEFDGRVPTNELKADLLARGVLSDTEIPTVTPGDLLQMAIGQGLMAASPIQVAVGYAAIANGGDVLSPKVVQTIYAPEVPDGEPGYADVAAGTVVDGFVPEARPIPMPGEVRDPIVEGTRRNILGPGLNNRSTTAEELFEIGYPEDLGAIPIAGKTGTAQGQFNYPWNDSSAFAAYSLDPNRPYTVVSYLEKAGFGSLGAAPVVKCMYLALGGQVPMDPVSISDPLDVTSEVAAEPLAPVDMTCGVSGDTDAALTRPAGGD